VDGVKYYSLTPDLPTESNTLFLLVHINFLLLGDDQHRRPGPPGKSMSRHGRNLPPRPRLSNWNAARIYDACLKNEDRFTRVFVFPQLRRICVIDHGPVK